MSRQPPLPLFQTLDAMLARADHAPECELERLGLAGNQDWVCVCGGSRRRCPRIPSLPSLTLTDVTAVTAVTDVCPFTEEPAMSPSSSTPVRLLPGPWSLQHFPDSQPMMLEQLAMQRSLLTLPFVIADVGDELEWFDELRGVTRLVGVAGLHQALVAAHDRMRAAKTRLREEGNVLTVFALDADVDLQLNGEQKAMVTDLWKDGHHFGETLLFHPNTADPIDTGALGVPPLVN
jgi:hypothetical protein